MIYFSLALGNMVLLKDQLQTMDVATFKVAANKDFGHSQKWILTYQICNTVVLDHLFRF